MGLRFCGTTTCGTRGPSPLGAQSGVASTLSLSKDHGQQCSKGMVWFNASNVETLDGVVCEGKSVKICHLLDDLSVYRSSFPAKEGTCNC